jgi:hypothetical protein
MFRADAAFAKPEIYEAMEEHRVKYAIRLPANDSLEGNIEELLTRPVERPSHKPIVWFKGFLYQAASWKTERRVVAKVEFLAGWSCSHEWGWSQWVVATPGQSLLVGA